MDPVIRLSVTKVDDIGAKGCGSGYCTSTVWIDGGNAVVQMKYKAKYTNVKGGYDYIDWVKEL